MHTTNETPHRMAYFDKTAQRYLAPKYREISCFSVESRSQHGQLAVRISRQKFLVFRLCLEAMVERSVTGRVTVMNRDERNTHPNPVTNVLKRCAQLLKQTGYSVRSQTDFTHSHAKCPELLSYTIFLR